MGTSVGIMPRMSPVLGRGPRTACQGARCLSMAVSWLPLFGYSCPMFGGIRSHLVRTCGNRVGDLEMVEGLWEGAPRVSYGVLGPPERSARWASW